MQGSIRFLLGVVLTFGALGALSENPYQYVVQFATIATVGLFLMVNGGLALSEQKVDFD